MGYSQFLNMIPEAFLVLALILVFVVDFIITNVKVKGHALACLTLGLLAVVTAVSVIAEPAEAFGGMYVTTAAANVMKVILAAGTFIVVLMAQPWVETSAINVKNEGEFYMLLISTLLGMFVMISSGHFLMFFLGLEMASVPMACLVALDKYKKKSAEAAAKYILTATFSSGIMLYGISMLYGATGQLYFGDFTAALAGNQHLTLLIVGLVFFFSGLGFKISLVPFHFWTADAYEGAPTPVTGYLSVVSKGAAAFALCTILIKVFAPMIQYWEYILYIVIVLSITIANLFAIRQKELKRFMAYSSISQAGYIMLAVVGASQYGVTALSYYVLVYVVANLAVFSVINAVEQNNGGRTDIHAYDGFYSRNPKLAFLMTLALFSLSGIPPFAGMFSKFFVFMAAAQQGSTLAYAVVFIALVNTVVSLYYYLLIVKAMYIRQAENPLPTFRTDMGTKAALFLCTAGILLFGICSCIYDWIFAAAA